MGTYPIKPSHGVVMGTPSGILYMEFTSAAQSAILPGDLVEFNNPPTDCTIKCAGADSEAVIGIADVHVGDLDTMGGGDVSTAYAVGAQVVVFRGSATCRLRIASSEEIQCGEFVQPAASGEVKAYICGTDHDCQRIAQALETVAQDTTSFQWGAFALERFG